MIDGLGSRYPLEGPSTRRPPNAPPNAAPPQPPPLGLAPDANLVQVGALPAYFDLPPLPFEAGPPPTPDRITLRGWRNIVVATHQAGMGGLLDAVARDLAAHAPETLEELPIAVEQHQNQSRQAARQALTAAQRTNKLGYADSTRKLALLAGETATDRAAAIAALKLADRAGGRTEAEHILFRLAQRANNPGDALATARRALALGQPDAAKYAYYRAAVLSPDAPSALATAREASAAGLRYEGREADFEAWKSRLDQQFRAMEGPQVGPGPAVTQSPYGQLALAKARYIHPYLAAMLKADRRDYPLIARAAANAGEHQAAHLIESRASVAGA